MTPFALLTLACTLVSAGLASAMIARDPALRVSRLTAMVPACVAWWGLFQTLWTVETDPVRVDLLIRLSSLGWISVGAFAFHAFVEMGGVRSARLRGWVPVLYGLSVASILIYAATPWGLGGVERASWGWGYSFGPLFPFAYLATAIPATLVVAYWREVHPWDGSWGERRVSRAISVGVVVAIVVASTTDVLMPALGRPMPQLAVPALTGVTVAVALHLRRFGYSLISPAAFAPEILDTLSEGVALLRSSGRIRDVNGALADLVGLSPASLRDRHVAEHLPDLGCERDWSRGLVNHECELVRRDGGRVPVELSSCALVREGGPTAGAALVVRDVRELETLRGRLVTSGRLAAVGELSAGIANEIRSPIEAVRGDLDALRGEWLALGEQPGPADPEGDDVEAESWRELFAEGEELIDECLEGVSRVVAIVRDVGGLAEESGAERSPVDLAALVPAALRLVRAADRGDVRIETDLAPIPRVLAVPQQLEQVLVNLLENALHAVGTAGRIRVATARRGGHVELRVSDDGPGVSPDLRERVFDPFFTTKPVGEGTGLGLAISYHIIRNHDGELRLESDGSGATFVVRLPIVAIVGEDGPEPPGSVTKEV